MISNLINLTETIWWSMGTLYNGVQMANMNISLALVQRGGGNGQNMSNGVWEFFDVISPVLDAIIVVVAIWGLFKMGAKLASGDEQAGKMILVILGSLLVWFFIVPELIGYMRGRDTSSSFN